MKEVLFSLLRMKWQLKFKELGEDIEQRSCLEILLFVPRTKMQLISLKMNLLMKKERNMSIALKTAPIKRKNKNKSQVDKVLLLILRVKYKLINILS